MELIAHLELHTTEDRGDHAGDVVQVIDCPETITLKEMIQHLIDKDGKVVKNDWLVIRVGERGKPTAAPVV